MNFNTFRAILLALPVSAFGSIASAATVDVRYHGPVSLDTFECPSLSLSSFVNRICSDEDREYHIVQLDDTF